MADKRMLIVKVCGSAQEKRECDTIETQAKLYDLKIIVFNPKTKDELETGLKGTGKFDYIYVSGHGNSSRLCSEDSVINIEWSDFSWLLCEADCMEEECKIMLSCCRGGLNQVAYSLFCNCPNIEYVVGPRQSLAYEENHIAYSLLLYLMAYKDIDPVVACEKVRLATDHRFMFFDRMEVEGEYNYFAWCDGYEKGNDEAVQVAKAEDEQGISPKTERSIAVTRELERLVEAGKLKDPVLV